MCEMALFRLLQRTLFSRQDTRYMSFVVVGASISVREDSITVLELLLIPLQLLRLHIKQILNINITIFFITFSPLIIFLCTVILRRGKALSKLYLCLSVSMLLKATATLLILTRSAIIVNQHRTHFSILTERFFQLANVTFLSKI